MNKAYVAGYNIITSLGNSIKANIAAMEKGVSGIALHSIESISSDPFYAGMVEAETFFIPGLTKFESLLATSVEKANVNGQVNLSSSDTLFIFSTTKGNIDHLETGLRLKISEACDQVIRHFGNSNKPILVSNACISGTLALLIGKRYIDNGRYKNVLICGADLVSGFVLSGFQSFKALSEGPCKPFDKNRQGLSLGEGAGAVILSSEKCSDIYIAGGGVSNDANHISGPSRTGEGLYLAIEAAFRDALSHDIDKKSIGYISAHGTATPYNDEMEAKAINSSSLNDVPLNSFKGHIGHTLGAAGLIETALGFYCLENNTLIPSANYQDHGVSVPLNIIRENTFKDFQAFLKTSSGFGGCNAALIVGKGEGS